MKQLPHISHRFSRFLVNVSADKKSLITDPSRITLGYILLDYALTIIQSGYKVSIHVNDADILHGIKAATTALNIDSQYSEANDHLASNWSTDFYPSQKAIKLGQQYLILGQQIGKQSTLHTLMTINSDVYLPIQQMVRSIPFALREPIIHEVTNLQSSTVNLIDYQWFFDRLDTVELSIDLLNEDINALGEAVNNIEKALSDVKSLGLTDGELKRQNHKTGSSQVLHMFSSKVTYQESLKELKILRISSDINPLNAAQLIDFLEQQRIDARQVLNVFNDRKVLEWIDAYSKCHPTSQELIRILTIYNIHSPWSEVIQYYMAITDTQSIDYSASKLAYKDALFYLRSYVGSLKDHLFVSSRMDIENPKTDTVYVLPVNTDSNMNSIGSVVSYQVGPSPMYYPRLDSIIVKQRLTDSELVHNARLLSHILGDRLPQVSIFLNRDHILISSREIRTSEVLDWLHSQEFEQLDVISITDSLMECFVDQSRTTHLITYGYLLDIETVSDWIFQTQVIETLDRLGLHTINVDLGYQNNRIKQSNLNHILNESFGD